MNGKNDTADEAAIRRIFDEWFVGTADKDIDRVMQHIASNVVSYEHDAPLQYLGADAVRAVCRKGMDLSGSGCGWDVPDTTIVIHGALAVQWGLNRMWFTGEDGKEALSWSRGTRVFGKKDGAWEMIHQHVSYPYQPETGLARTDLTPDSASEDAQPPTTPPASSEEARVRETIEQWVRAVQSHDLAGVVANHTSDVVMFDVPLPVANRGIEAYRGTWPPFFDWQRQEHGTFEIVSLNVTAGETVAFATAVLRCGSKKELTADNAPKLRLTIGLVKQGAQWLIAHEHHSFPVEGS